MPRNKTSTTTVVRLEAEALDLALREPFAIATGQVDSARNMLVRVTLADGSVGIGEAAPFPPSGGESQETALAAAQGMAALVEGQDAARWRSVAALLLANFEHQATARAGIEVALLDALTRSWGISLHQYFGAAESQLLTDITIPLAPPEHVAELAAAHAARGAQTLKIKVGTDVEDDLDRVLAAAAAAPDCELLLDGNQGYTASEALDLLRALAEEDVEPILFEQPVHREDLDGLRYVAERARVPVAADESVHTPADALRIVRLGAAQVINIKLMKSGVAGALDIAAICRAAHVGLMVGAMMESRLGAAASAALVAGVGGFRYIDLDTPMLLDEDPFTGGYEQEGMTYRLDGVRAGLGVSLREESA